MMIENIVNSENFHGALGVFSLFGIYLIICSWLITNVHYAILETTQSDFLANSIGAVLFIISLYFFKDVAIFIGYETEYERIHSELNKI